MKSSEAIEILKSDRESEFSFQYRDEKKVIDIKRARVVLDGTPQFGYCVMVYGDNLELINHMDYLDFDDIDVFENENDLKYLTKEEAFELVSGM